VWAFVLDGVHVDIGYGLDARTTSAQRTFEKTRVRLRGLRLIRATRLVERGEEASLTG